MKIAASPYLNRAFTILMLLPLLACSPSPPDNNKALSLVREYHQTNKICLENGSVKFPVNSNIREDGTMFHNWGDFPYGFYYALAYDRLANLTVKDVTWESLEITRTVTNTEENHHYKWKNSNYQDDRIDTQRRILTVDKKNQTVCVPISEPFVIENIGLLSDEGGRVLWTIEYSYEVIGNPVWPIIMRNHAIKPNDKTLSVAKWGDPRAEIKKAQLVVVAVGQQWQLVDAKSINGGKLVHSIFDELSEEEIYKRMPRKPKLATLCTDEEIDRTRRTIAEAITTPDSEPFANLIRPDKGNTFVVNPANCHTYIEVSASTAPIFNRALENDIDLSDPVVQGDHFASLMCHYSCVLRSKLAPIEIEVDDPRVQIRKLTLHDQTGHIAKVGEAISLARDGARVGLDINHFGAADRLTIGSQILKAVSGAGRNLGRSANVAIDIDTALAILYRAKVKASVNAAREEIYSACIRERVERDLNSGPGEYLCISE